MIRKNILSIITALIIVLLSLSKPENFENVGFFNFPHADKIAHFGLYFILMSIIIIENRKTIKSTDQLLLIALIPLCFGILIEICQSAFTVSRTGSIYDVLSNLAGILFAIFLLWLIKPFKRLLIRL